MKTSALFSIVVIFVSIASADPLGRIGICASCHGVDGNIVDVLYPKIGGQQQNYMVSELKAYRDGIRNTPDASYMGVMRSFSDEEIQAIAQYFSAQKPLATPLEVDPAVLALGKNLYENGVPSRSVDACIDCHGAKAEGRSKTPRLAGQSSDYFIKQMAWYKSGERTGRQMPDLNLDFTQDEIEALALYLETLN